ncbi:MAG: hypothetical protein IJ773_06655 [Lachnospiraceae bacterium]|nr:hypothetical protein [Lachnospiraceae bacterium]
MSIDKPTDPLKQTKKTRIYRWMVVMITTLITVLWLYGIRHAEHEVKLENGVYVLTKEQLAEDV